LRCIFRKKRIELLYTEEKGANKYSAQVVDAFFEVMGVIQAAKDERDLYALKGLHFEKLKGGRQSERSLKLNDQYRLIVELAEDKEGKFIEVIDIEDYH
jgi:toxin HigB-1